MQVFVFDTHGYDRESFTAENARFGHELGFIEPRLSRETAALAASHALVNEVRAADVIHSFEPRAGAWR